MGHVTLVGDEDGGSSTGGDTESLLAEVRRLRDGLTFTG